MSLVGPASRLGASDETEAKYIDGVISNGSTFRGDRNAYRE